MSRRFEGGRLVIASHNAGKVHEISELLAAFGTEVISAYELGLPEPEETEDTFEGNSRIKAHAAATRAGLPALSDDSGLMVDALNGAPGVYTADWSETPLGRDFQMAMRKVWDLLEERAAPEPRTARFCCTLCLAWPDGGDVVVAGTVEGRLVWPARGDQGFGFDPMFLPSGETQTFGEMEPVRKHAMSHRADAFEKLIRASFA